MFSKVNLLQSHYTNKIYALLGGLRDYFKGMSYFDIAELLDKHNIEVYSLKNKRLKTTKEVLEELNKKHIVFDAQDAKDKCVQWIRDWFAENGPDCKAIIGISGGKDSSVVAALCAEALGKDRVFGVMMPCGTQTDISDSYKIVNFLDIPHVELDIFCIAEDFSTIAYRGGISSSEQADINLSPRIRMTMLYFVSQSINGRVACTDNLSESYIGYSTRWGDNVGDFCPLANFTSEEVVAIGDALGLPYELTHKVPSDGLCGKTDEDRFGFTYEVLNKYIRTGICEDKKIKNKIDEMHQKNLFKLSPIPKFIYHTEEFIDEILL